MSFQLYLEAIFAAWTKLSCEQDTLDQAGMASLVDQSSRAFLGKEWCFLRHMWSRVPGGVCVCVQALCVRAHEPPATTISSAKVTMAVRRQLQAGLP